MFLKGFVFASVSLSVIVVACADLSQSAKMPLATKLKLESKLESQLGSVPAFQEFLGSEYNKTARRRPAPNCAADCQKARTEFRYVVYVGKQIYAYWNLKKAETGTDFDVLAEKLEASITDETTPTQYFDVLRRYAAAFHDGHVNVLMKPDRSDIEFFSTNLRFEVLAPGTEREKLIVVTSSEPAVKVGDVVLKVDERPSAAALDLAETTVSGSTKRMRRFFAANRISDVLGIENGARPLKLVLLRDGTELEVEVPRKVVLNVPPPAVPPAIPLEQETGLNLVNAMVMRENIGYLRIDGFSGSQDRALLEQAMQRLKGTKGLIIDLRKNGGGSQAGSAILAHLIDVPMTRYETSERLSDFTLHARPEYFPLLQDALGLGSAEGPFAKWHAVEVPPAAGGAVYAGKPVVALTSPNCFSACDTFSSGLKVAGLGFIVGEGTGGGTGSPLVFELPYSGHSFRYSVVQGRTSSGELIEGVGTLPDFEVEPSREDRVNGKDTQLEVAFAQLLEKLGDHRGLTSELSKNAVAEAVARFGVHGTQTLDAAPYILEIENLQRIAARDELP